MAIAEQHSRSRSLVARGLPVTHPLIGRDAEVASLTALLARSRLVTVVGAGGVGKTQLALEVARRLAPSFADGAVLVTLADIDDPALVASEIARSLDLVDVSGSGLTEQLIAAMRRLRILIVLDNFERLVAAAPAVAAVWAHCPGTTLLVTSRRRLGLTAERTFRLQPLAVLAPDTHGELTEIASIALFCERAVSVSSEFQPRGTDLVAIGEICRLVDGLPLAIELVASHVRVLALEALLARLQGPASGLALLKGGAADADARHRDLRETIGWSVDLLGDDASRLLPRLSVFRNGWTLDAMERVCCADIAADVRFEALVELIDLHLVDPVDQAGREPRFRLLETVRRFAMDSLVDHGDAGATSVRHADYYMSAVVRAKPALETRDERRAMARIDQELPNIRATLHHLWSRGQVDDGLATAAALGRFWLDRGPIGEGREWIDRFLPSATRSPGIAAVAEGWSIRLAIEQGDTSTFGSENERNGRLRRARDVVNRDDDVSDWIRLTEHLSIALRLDGRFHEADALLVEALDWCTTPETAWFRAELLVQRVLVARGREDRDSEHIAILVRQIDDVAQSTNEPRARVARALTRHLVPDAPISGARAELEEAFYLSQEIGDRRAAARTALESAVLALVDRDRPGAAAWFVRGIDAAVAVGDLRGVALSVMGAAGLAASAGHLREGARLHGAIRAHLDLITEAPPAHMAAYQRVVDKLQEGLADEFDAECRVGARRSWPETVDAAHRIGAELASEASLAKPRQHRPRGSRANPALTERELDVLRLLVEGGTNRRVADELGISPKTVMHHTVSVYRKLAVRSRAEAVAHAIRNGIIAE